MQVLPYQPPKLVGPPSIPSPRKLSSSIAVVSPSSNLSTPTGSYNHQIQSLCKRGNLSQAIDLLASETNPTQHTYELLLLACVRRKAFPIARFVHRHLLANGFEQDSFLATKLINVYSEFESLEDARKVFNETTIKTSFVYSAFFRALTLAGEGIEVLELYRRMNCAGLASDRYTFNYALKACVAADSTVSSMRNGKEIHARILRDAHEKEVHCMTTLVDAYAKFGSVSYAHNVFDKMEEKNLVSYSAMINCYLKNEQPLESLNLFKKMMTGRKPISPNSVTMVSVLGACAALAALGLGRVLHGYTLRNGLDSILPVLNALITMYSRCGELEMGQRVFDQMKIKDVVSWNSLISSYGVHGYGQKAVEIFVKMKQEGVKPTPVSFISVLGACSHSGLVEEGTVLFSSMLKEHGMIPNVEHYACMVDLLGRANKLHEAAELISGMRMEPGSKVWGALLGSCRIHGNVELAERASKRLFSLEPDNAGNYVLLADIYAATGMWEEVKKMKILIEKKGLQKLSGCSWTEARRRVHAFLSVDEFNPQIEQLHALLVNLSKEMKEKGYKPLTRVVLYDVEEDEKEKIVLGHSEKLALAFGLINTSQGETIRICKNLRLCEDCHSFTKFVSKFADRRILVRDVNRIHSFEDGVCSCGDYW